MAMTQHQIPKIESFYTKLLLQMVNGGMKGKGNHSYVYTNIQIMNITKTKSIKDNKTPKDLMHRPEYIKKLQDIPTDSIKCGPPSYEEIVSTIKNMRKKKASTDIPIELLQATIH